MGTFRSAISGFARTIVCCFALAATTFSVSLYANLWGMKHPYHVDGPAELNFVIFTVLPVMLLATTVVAVLDVVRYFRERRSSHA